MSKRRTAAATAVAVMVLLLPVAVAGSVAVSVRPANEIPAQSVTADDRPQRSTSEAWNTVPSVNIPLASVPSGIPNASGTSIESVRVQSVQTDEWLYLRLSWTDGATDRNATSPRLLLDVAAVQVPANTSVRPSILMGSARNLVNAWYWSVDGETEELPAGGPGSTTEFERTAVKTTASYDDGRWAVVVSCPLDSDVANRTSFAVDDDADVAFAVWNGSEMERSGRKSISEWHHFPLDPEPQGPPHELILWTAAGLAIVGVALVIIGAVRKN